MNITEKIKELESQIETSEGLLKDIRNTIKENKATIRKLKALEKKANEVLGGETVTVKEIDAAISVATTAINLVKDKQYFNTGGILK